MAKSLLVVEPRVAGSSPATMYDLVKYGVRIPPRYGCVSRQRPQNTCNNKITYLNPFAAGQTVDAFDAAGSDDGRTGI